MNEQQFIEIIDCKFPYDDIEASLELIKKAKTISDNSMFCVLHEIVRPSREISIELKKQLYSLWLNNFDHKLINPVKEAADAIIENDELPQERVLDLLTQFDNEINQYCAISILYFSCNDINGKVNTKYNKIIEYWNKA